jgi:aminopeptidase N
MVNRMAIVLCCGCFAAFGTDPYPRNTSIDVVHYTFRIDLNDTTDIIAGYSDITVQFSKAVDKFSINLAVPKPDGTGMHVIGVNQSGKPVAYMHYHDKIDISLPDQVKPGDTATYSIFYQGVPGDGLVISTNKFGDRTFFGDNWPDRGHQWLPTVDHPSDKARVDFIIMAPDHYNVVATGELVGEKSLPGKRKETHWREHANVATKVITIGVARFAIQQSGSVGKIPVTTWVFPQNAKEGFIDFAIGPRVLTYLQDYIGPYPYEKLAHVQSKTRWGGLENVSNIFYFENSVNGKKERDGLIAHETAHQWFGNSVTENDWHHVWLSEGFATYFSALFLGSAYGEDRFQKEMTKSRSEIIEFSQKKNALVIDTTIQDIGEVLSISTYQKASWVLHMLRVKIGDESFKQGIREYYQTFRDGNAMTADFINVMETISKQDLDPFFDAWLLQPGHPRLSGNWTYDGKRKAVRLQLHTSGFDCPPGTTVTIKFTQPGGKAVMNQCRLDLPPGTAVYVPMARRPASIVIDPAVELLFEGEIKEKR